MRFARNAACRPLHVHLTLSSMYSKAGAALGVLAAVFLLLCACPPARGADPFVEGEVLVGFRPGIALGRIAAFEQRNGLVRTRAFPQIRAYRYRLPPGEATMDAVARLGADPIVAYAEPNWLLRRQALPADPSFPEQWYLRNTGQAVNGDSGPAGEDIRWVEAMAVFSGTREIVVAVLDSGIALGHPELAGRMWTNAGDPDPANGADEDDNGYIDDGNGWDFYGGNASPWDQNGHGTLVASLIAARRDNGAGGAGVSPSARIMDLRVASAGGDLGLTATGDVIAALLYAGLRGARIVNASFGGSSYSASTEAAVRWLNGKGVLLVAAAGNGGGNGIGDNNEHTPFYPASYASPNVIAVAATDRSGALADFSNYGGTSVHIAAPGTDIFGADLQRGVIFGERFDAGAPGWTSGSAPGSSISAPWSFYTDAEGNHWARDGPSDYAQNSDTWFMTPSIQTGIATRINYRRSLYLASGDCFRFEVSEDDGLTWTTPGHPFCGPANSDAVRDIDLSEYDLKTVRVRFRLTSDGSSQSDGVYLDYVDITSVMTSSYEGTEYQYASGTSFAAPLVSGVAALAWSQRPDLSASQVRQILLSSARPDARLAGRVSSGGKLDAAAALAAAIATPPGIGLSSEALAFGRQTIGTTAAPRTVLLSNLGTAGINLTGITSSDPAVFPLQSDCPLGAVLSAGASCALSARFAPGASGESGGTVRIDSDAPGSPHVVNFIGVGAVDGTPPSVPGGLAAQALGASRIGLAWSASSDDVGIAAYRVLRNGAMAAEVSGATGTFVDAGLAALTTYGYAVQACDAAGNCSAASDPAFAATGPAPVLTVTVATAGGTVTSTPAAIDCTSAGGACAATVPEDQPITLTAAAASGYVFGGWTGECAQPTGVCTLAMSANRAASAAFAPGAALPIAASGFNLAGNGTGVPLDVLGAFGDADHPVPGVSERVESVWNWNAATRKWRFHAPQLTQAANAAYAAARGYEPLATIAPGEGYWLNVTEPTVLFVPQASAHQHDAASFAALPSGFNLLASGGEQTVQQFAWRVGPPPAPPGSVSMSFNTLWAWDVRRSRWYFYAPALEQAGAPLSNCEYAASHGMLDFGGCAQANESETIPAAPAPALDLPRGAGFWVEKF
ncbi:MAG: S8 family serine peptidase [Burkholderiales bacterium]|nr:S8 family serine peptidase [Burkholderiales bacterium]